METISVTTVSHCQTFMGLSFCNVWSQTLGFDWTWKCMSLITECPHMCFMLHALQRLPESGPAINPPSAEHFHFLGSSAASLCFFMGRKWISCELTFFSLIALFLGTFLSGLLGSCGSAWDADGTP